MLVNWKGIKRIFWTYKYKRQKWIQNLEFKYSAPRKPSYFSKCLAHAKVKCSLGVRHPNREIPPSQLWNSHCWLWCVNIPTPMCTNMHSPANNPAEREVLIEQITAPQLPGSPERDAPATFGSGADQHVRRHHLPIPAAPAIQMTL